jgi:hypothetical protein
MAGAATREENRTACPAKLGSRCGRARWYTGEFRFRMGQLLEQGPRQSHDLSGSYHRRVGPVSGGRQLGVWRRETDWRPTRTFRYCARAWPWRRSVVACRLDSSEPWDVFGAYRPPEPSDWLGGIACVQLPRDRAARWWFAPVVPPRGRNRRVAVSKGGTTVSTSVSALFYFLALVCFLAGAFAGLGRSSFATRVNLIALGLAFWVFVLFFNAFKRVIS